MFLIIFRQHFINVSTFLVNIFLETSSNIFQKCYNIFMKRWFRQLFFSEILRNVATFFRNVGQQFLMFNIFKKS
jgi:predicted DNA-binding ArsR family transcriptional regulator